MTIGGLAALARVADGGPRTRDRQPTLAIGEPADVYRNLHHGKGPVHFWSVRSRRSGLVMGVVAFVELADVVFRVGERARQTVLETRRRSVHAVAGGTLRAWDVDRTPRRPAGVVEVTYNPNRAPYFHLADARHPTQLVPVYRAARLWFDRGGAWMDAESAREARRAG